jgi:hypothetical protein
VRKTETEGTLKTFRAARLVREETPGRFLKGPTSQPTGQKKPASGAGPGLHPID